MNAEPASPLPSMSFLAAMTMERFTLLLNHVLAAEPVATQRLRPHAGRTLTLRLQGWPSLLPALPPLSFRVTPAGLLEWSADGPVTEPALLLVVEAADPLSLLARSLAGERGKVDIQGDAALAADVSWLMDNLRWDVREDLSRIVGPVLALQAARVGGVLSRGLREALRWIAARRAGELGPGGG